MTCTRREKDKKNKLQVTQPPPGCSNTRELIMIYLQCTAESWSKTSSVKRLVTSASCSSPWARYVLVLPFSVQLFAPQSVIIMCLELRLRLLFWFDNLHFAPTCGFLGGVLKRSNNANEHSPSFDLSGNGLLQTALIMSVCVFVGESGGREMGTFFFKDQILSSSLVCCSFMS